MSTKLFNLTIFTGTKEELIQRINSCSNKLHIISGNAEVLKAPLHDENIFSLFDKYHNIIIPDGISVYYPVKRKNKHCRKIPGIELMQSLLDEFEKNGKGVYFLGAKEAILVKMMERLAVSHPQLKVAGSHHGYFDKDHCAEIINSIQKSGTYALFAALGTPAQENFIFRYMDELPCILFMGVGGSFDVLSGVVKRSPRWMSAIGIEWLYRLIGDPSKIGRMWNNISFTIKALLWG